MSTSLEARDCYGLIIKVGDSIISSVSPFSGKVIDIYKDKNYLWITIFDEKTQTYINDLNPHLFTTPKRYANKKIEYLEKENEKLKKENADLKQRLEKSEAARLDNL